MRVYGYNNTYTSYWYCTRKRKLIWDFPSKLWFKTTSARRRERHRESMFWVLRTRVFERYSQLSSTSRLTLRTYRWVSTENELFYTWYFRPSKLACFDDASLGSWHFYRRKCSKIEWYNIIMTTAGVFGGGLLYEPTVVAFSFTFNINIVTWFPTKTGLPTVNVNDLEGYFWWSDNVLKYTLRFRQSNETTIFTTVKCVLDNVKT